MNAKYIKTVIILLSVMIISISCKAQNLPLQTASKNIPNNAHIKDTNNELTPYIGTYKANFIGNEITLFITKENGRLTNYGNQKFYRDALVIKYIIKNSLGIIVQDTQNTTQQDINEIFSTKLRSSDASVCLTYSGTNCNVGWGDIYLKKINANQISWEYIPDDITTTAAKCPPTLDTTIYLPETENLIFTKQ